MKFDYKGEKYTCDENAIRSYSVIKKLTTVEATNDMAGFFDALDKVFCGHADEYAEKLGDSFDEIAELLSAAQSACGSKN